QVFHRAGMGLGDEAVLAGDAVAFDDLVDPVENLHDLLQLARDRPDAQPCRQREAESLRVKAGGVTLDDSALLEAANPLCRAWARQARCAGEIGDAGAAVTGQCSKDQSVDRVKSSISVSKAFHAIGLSLTGNSAIIPRIGP